MQKETGNRAGPNAKYPNPHPQTVQVTDWEQAEQRQNLEVKNNGPKRQHKKGCYNRLTEQEGQTEVQRFGTQVDQGSFSGWTEKITIWQRATANKGFIKEKT